MKGFIVLLLAAAASAQYYTPYIGHSGFYGVHKPFLGSYSQISAGGIHNTLYKREAEADPMYYTYGSYMTPTYYHGLKHAATPVVYKSPVYSHVPHMKTYSNDAVKPFNYAAKGTYHADSLGAKHIAKREAEPFYYGSYGSHFTYPTYTSGYSSYYPSYYSGYSHLYKREAEAEPFYYGTHQTAYPVTTGYSSYYPSHYTGYTGYSGLYRGLYKRDAESFYGTYGYPSTYSTGYSSYHYPSYLSGYTGYTGYSGLYKRDAESFYPSVYSTGYSKPMSYFGHSTYSFPSTYSSGLYSHLYY